MSAFAAHMRGLFPAIVEAVAEWETSDEAARASCDGKASA